MVRNSRRLWLSKSPWWKGFPANFNAVEKVFPDFPAARSAIPAEAWAVGTFWKGKWLLENRSHLRKLCLQERSTAQREFSGRMPPGKNGWFHFLHGHPAPLLTSAKGPGLSPGTGPVCPGNVPVCPGHRPALHYPKDPAVLLIKNTTTY